MANTTKIGAVLDKQIIKVFYQHENDTDVAASQLTFSLNHHYATKAGNEGDLLLEKIVVPVDYVQAGINGSVFSYEASVQFVNPKYYTHLTVTVSEHYMGSGPASYNCDVLEGDSDLIIPLPVNPVRPPQFIENEPVNPLPENSPDIVVLEPVANPYLYSPSTHGVSVESYSKKIVYSRKDNKFSETTENEIINLDNVYIENGITNFAKNASFLDVIESSGSNFYPKDWQVDAPGFIVSSGFFDSDIENINFWQLHLTNPNPFSAIDSIALKTSARIPLGTSQLAMSLRYQQFIGDTPSGNDAPFETVVLKSSFIASDDSIISQSQISSSLIFTSDNLWEICSFCFSCPTSAVRIDMSIETGSIKNTMLSTLRILLPQLENCYTATSPCLTVRRFDKIQSPRQVRVQVPVGFVIQTTHTTTPEIRGLAELNEAGSGGVRIYLSNGRINFRQLDEYGSIIFTAQSLPVPRQPGETVSYCTYIDSAGVHFYADGSLISSAAGSLNFNYSANIIIGSLIANNTTINSKLGNVSITTIKPGA